MKPLVEHEEEFFMPAPEEEAMLDAAIAEADAGNFVDSEAGLLLIRREPDIGVPARYGRIQILAIRHAPRRPPSL